MRANYASKQNTSSLLTPLPFMSQCSPVNALNIYMDGNFAKTDDSPCTVWGGGGRGWWGRSLIQLISYIIKTFSYLFSVITSFDVIESNHQILNFIVFYNALRKEHSIEHLFYSKSSKQTKPSTTYISLRYHKLVPAVLKYKVNYSYVYQQHSNSAISYLTPLK